MPVFQIATLHLLIALTAVVTTAHARAGVGTSVPISAELATNIGGSLFPVGVQLREGNILLTEPQVVFIDQKRIGVHARFQAYDHRPNEGIAISEMGRALVSGELQYDLGSRQVLLYNPKIDKLEFDRSNAATQRLQKSLQAEWSLTVANPLRSEIPPHPYVLPFKDHIQNISYDGKRINLDLYYE